MKCSYYLICDNEAYKNIISTSLGYELSFCTSFAKVGRLGMENNCMTQTDTM